MVSRASRPRCQRYLPSPTRRARAGPDVLARYAKHARWSPVTEAESRRAAGTGRYRTGNPCRPHGTTSAVLGWSGRPTRSTPRSPALTISSAQSPLGRRPVDAGYVGDRDVPRGSWDRYSAPAGG